MKKILIQLVLVLGAIYLTYEIVDTIKRPIEFNKEKDKRYEEVVKKLKDIRKAENAYKGVYGEFTGSWDTLISFVKTDSLPFVRKIGALSDSMLKAGWTEAKAIKKGLIIRDTVRVSVLDTVFNSSYLIDELNVIPYGNGKKFFLGASTITTGSGVVVPVFEARAHTNVILGDLIDAYGQEIINLNEERRMNSKYPGLKVGSLSEANNSAGNWE